MDDIRNRGGVPAETGWTEIKLCFGDAIDLPMEALPAFIESRGLPASVSEQLVRMVAQRAAAASFFSSLSEEIAAFGDEAPCLEEQETIGGRFRIRRFLARGGMGEVYHAQDLELGGDLAVKVMRPGLAAYPGSLKRFREEIRLARKVASPHVCQVYDVGRHAGPGGDFLFFTMELLEGETLSERIFKQGPLNFEEARPLIGHILAGLAAAHAKGVIHRDLKTSNVMLCDEPNGPRAVITDFGLCQALAETAGEEMLDGITPEYVAPEVIKGGGASVVSDIYSFGVVASEIFTGRPIFGSVAQLTLPGAPSKWQKTIRRCLIDDPAQRFKSAAEVARELGFQPSRPMDRRLFVVLSLGTLTATAITVRSFSHGRAPGKTMAVLPFRAAAEMEYMASGLADRMADCLSRIPGVQVVSRAASARLKAKNTNLADAGGQLNCSYVLSGSIDGTAETCRVHMDVGDAASGVSKWSGTFDTNEEEAALIPEQALRAIIPQLEWSDSPEVFRYASTPTRNPLAYRSYLLGRFLADKRDIASLRESIKYFERSIALDGRFAIAHAALAHACCDLAFQDGPTLNANMTRARTAAARAFEIDPNCAEAHFVQGDIYHWWRWDWERSEASFRRCIAINPSLPQAHYWYSKMLYPQKRFEDALAVVDTAIRLDPLNPSARVTKGTILTFAGRLDQAVDLLRMVTSAEPGSPNAHGPLSDALAFRGDFDEALRAAERAVVNSGRQSFALAQVAALLPRFGRTAEALAIKAELEARITQGDAYPTEIAFIAAALHDADGTLFWLEKGLKVHDDNLPVLRIYPGFAFVSGDPRFGRIASAVFSQKAEEPQTSA
jgi:serine/threonine-protein kinase